MCHQTIRKEMNGKKKGQTTKTILCKKKNAYPSLRTINSKTGLLKQILKKLKVTIHKPK